MAGMLDGLKKKMKEYATEVEDLKKENSELKTKLQGDTVSSC